MAEMSPEVQAQLEEQKKNCPFCKIVAGEIQASEVYKDKQLTGILDINPWVKGHVLLLSNDHYPIMPVLPPDVFKHMFGKLSAIIGALKKAMLTTGANVFVANGGIAGQQAPHFLVHLLPREEGDGVYNYDLDGKKDIDSAKVKEVNEMIVKNLPIMMQNHFQRNPAKWHDGNIKSAKFLEGKEILYEDEKAICVAPENPQCIGHLVIYSQEEEFDFDKLSFDSSAHLFYLASFASTAVFEGLKAQGSNIILKSGRSDDNPEGKLSIHILPRFENDGIDVIGKPMSSKPDLAAVGKKIKEEMFMVENSSKEEKTETINLDEKEEVIKISSNNSELSPSEEIQKAIEEMRK